MPAVRWRSTTPVVSSSTSCASEAESTGSPRLCRTNASVNGAGRGRLPAWVVRTRVSLRHGCSSQAVLSGGPGEIPRVPALGRMRTTISSCRRPRVVDVSVANLGAQVLPTIGFRSRSTSAASADTRALDGDVLRRCPRTGRSRRHPGADAPGSRAARLPQGRVTAGQSRRRPRRSLPDGKPIAGRGQGSSALRMPTCTAAEGGRLLALVACHPVQARARPLVDTESGGGRGRKPSRLVRRAALPENAGRFGEISRPSGKPAAARR